ncbi:MAG TPA: glycoside hydrolase family 15 protein [Mycobacteriales bacterium]
MTPTRSASVSIADVRDADGFAPIGQYAVLGDGRGSALVAPDGAIDWWAVPRLDSPPAFSALLDPVLGGRLHLRPADTDAVAERRYVPHTNLLETTFRAKSGVVTVTDSLNSGNAGELPWGELARRVEGVEGSVEMQLVVRPGDGLREWEPWVEHDGRAPVLHAGRLTLGVRCSAEIDVHAGPEQVDASFRVRAGERRIVAVVATLDEPLFLCDVDAIDRRMDLSADAWRRWAGQVSWDGAGRETIVRSALALKLLLITQTGAIAAAATTSLPESIGGPKNWDYRYCWVRDAALTIDALSICGQQEEVHAAITWLLAAIRRNGPDVHVMYDLDGHLVSSTRHAAVPGYKHSLPVQVGNDATSQVQLGVYGDLFGTVADWVFGGHVLDTQSARELSDLADQCADMWRHEDAGIWELQANRHYTTSKMNCWRALDAAARLARAGQLTGTGERWKHEAVKVKAWIHDNCWSGSKNAYTFYAGTEDLDASVLLGSGFGFDRGKNMASTVDAITDELGVGPLVYRYSGAEREEQTFLACAYWRAGTLADVGRVDEAERLMKELDAVVSPLGLLSEMATAGSNELIGNMPQALSHLALIRAADGIRAARS